MKVLNYYNNWFIFAIAGRPDLSKRAKAKGGCRHSWKSVFHALFIHVQSKDKETNNEATQYYTDG